MAAGTNRKLTRRQFVNRAAGAVAAFTIVPRHVLGGGEYVAPSDKLNVAVVGCGGQGMTNIKQLMMSDDVQVVAIADPTTFADYEKFYYGGVGGRGPTKQKIE